MDKHVTCEAPNAARLPAFVKLSWGLGQLAPYTVFSIVSAQLLVYLTDQVAIIPVVAGLILFGAKLYDAVSDVVVGLWSDRTVSRWGRRRPWMAAGAVVLACSLVAMFHVDRAAPDLRVAAATLAVAMFFTGVSLFTIPHMAMSAEIADDYHERTSIQVYGSVFGTISALIGTALAPLLMIGPGAEAHHRMAWLLAPVPLIAGLLCVAGTARAPRPIPQRAAMPSTRMWLTSFAGNRPLLVLLSTKALHLVSTSSMLSALLFFCIQVLGIGQKGIVVFGLAGASGSLIGLFITARFLARTRSKHQLYGLMLIGLAGAVYGYMLVPPGNLWAFAIPPFCLSMTASPGLMLANSMVADVVEHDHLNHGVHRAGAIHAIVSTVHKAAPALSGLIVGGILSLGGYRAGAAAQSPEAIRAITICVSILPGTGLLLASLPMLFFYKLDAATLERQRRERAMAAAE